MFKRLSAAFIAFCMLASVASVAVSAADLNADGVVGTNGKKSVSYAEYTSSVKTGQITGDDSSFDYIPDSIPTGEPTAVPLTGAWLLTATSPMDSAYSSVTEGLISSVKNQKTYGLCWAFGATAASEASLTSSGQRDTLFDLSELQLAYNIQGQLMQDPLGNATGDGMLINNGEWRIGGNYSFTMWGLAAWKNGTEETYYPYTLVDDGMEAGYNGQNDVAHLQNFRVIEFEADINETDYKVTAVGENRDIKQAIIDYGAVAASYQQGFTGYQTKADYSNKENGFSPYNDVYGSYFLNTLYFNGGGHAISIVGWNDDFPKEYFTEEAPGNGAWLCKNSWSTAFGTDGDAAYDDYADAEPEGYFWISYYDIGLNNNYYVYAFDFENTSETEYDNNYQYDGGSATSAINDTDTPYDFSIGASYEIKASAAEKLRAVGFGTYSENVLYSVQLYKLNNLTDQPIEQGTPLLAEPITGKTDYMGYYTIEIPEESQPTLQKGDYISIVITLKGTTETLVVAADKTVAYSGRTNYADTTNDITFGYFSEGYESLRGSGYTLRVKAYTSNEEDGASLQISTAALSLFPSSSLQNTATLSPICRNLEGYTLSWKSSNTRVATVDQNGLVKAQKPGTATVTLTATKRGAQTFKATCTVTVNKLTASLTASKTKIYFSDDMRYAYLDIKHTSGSTVEYGVADVACGHCGKLDSNYFRGMYTSYLKDGIGIRFSPDVTRLEIYDYSLCGGKTTEITVYDRYSGKSVTFRVYVEMPREDISVTPSVTLKEGKTATLNCETAYIYSDVVWESENDAVATVDQNGTVTAVSVGTCRIKVTNAAGKTAYCNVTVNGVPKLTGVSVKTASVNTKPLMVKNISDCVKPVFSDGKAHLGEYSVTYRSSDSRVVTVLPNGTVIGLKKGTAVVTVKITYRGVSYSADVTVNVGSIFG